MRTACITLKTAVGTRTSTRCAVRVWARYTPAWSTQRSTPCAWRDGFPSRCPCPCEPRPVPSAQPRPSPASAAKSPDFAIILLGQAPGYDPDRGRAHHQHGLWRRGLEDVVHYHGRDAGKNPTRNSRVAGAGPHGVAEQFSRNFVPPVLKRQPRSVPIAAGRLQRIKGLRPATPGQAWHPSFPAKQRTGMELLPDGIGQDNLTLILCIGPGSTLAPLCCDSGQSIRSSVPRRGSGRWT